VKACSSRSDDLTGTVLAGHHQPLRVWVPCLYFMGLNLSNWQIALELGPDTSDVQAMMEQLRRGLPRFNRLSQHGPEPIAALGQTPPRAFANQGSCEAWR